MIILGIDPGSRKVGFALLEVHKRSLTYLDSGVLHFDHIDLFLDRIGLIYQSALQLVEKYKPQQIALESLIYVKSPTALIKLAQSRGAMLAAFAQTHHGQIYEYSPNLVKSTATGHGHAKKENVQKFLDLVVGKVEYETHDESDAVAVAICHALQMGPLGQKITSEKIKSPNLGRKKSRSGGLGNSLKHAVKKQIEKENSHDRLS